MTALIGYCFNNGAFLAADTRRLIENSNCEQCKVVPAQAIKIHNLTPRIGIAKWQEVRRKFIHEVVGRFKNETLYTCNRKDLFDPNIDFTDKMKIINGILEEINNIKELNVKTVLKKMNVI